MAEPRVMIVRYRGRWRLLNLGFVLVPDTTHTEEIERLLADRDARMAGREKGDG